MASQKCKTTKWLVQIGLSQWQAPDQNMGFPDILSHTEPGNLPLSAYHEFLSTVDLFTTIITSK